MEGEMAIMIPIIALCIPFFAIWTKHKEKVAKLNVEATAEHTAEKAAQYAGNIKSLEDRVQVLERIVTDRGYDIATQIEALRDTREVQQSGAGVPLNMNAQEKA